jgi:hypothetical protein
MLNFVVVAVAQIAVVALFVVVVAPIVVVVAPIVVVSFAGARKKNKIKTNYFIENGTPNLPDCGIVPQPTRLRIPSDHAMNFNQNLT